MTIEPDHFRQTLARSPFTERIEAMSHVEEWTSWNGYKVPRVVDQISAEYFAVRSGCSVMDMTPMEKYRISGAESFEFLNRLLVRNIDKLRPGRVTYVAWCNDEGKILDDGTLYQFDENDYRLCSQHHQLDWLQLSAAGFDVRIEVETDEFAAIAVQGPTSYAVLTAAGLTGLADMKPFDVEALDLSGIPVTVSRTGYTGDLGYELWFDPNYALAAWDTIFALQGTYDIHAIGLSTLEVVRVEAGYIMPGFDFNSGETTLRAGYDRSILEAGLGWLVDFDKGHFTGKKALLREREGPIRRRMLKIVIDGNKPAAHALLHNGKKGKKIGEIKAAAWSPIQKKNLGLADVEYTNGKPPSDLWARLDYQIELAWKSKWVRCEIVDAPFYQPAHRSITPPGIN